MEIKKRMLGAQNNAVDDEARAGGLKLAAKQVLTVHCVWPWAGDCGASSVRCTPTRGVVHRPRWTCSALSSGRAQRVCPSSQRCCAGESSGTAWPSADPHAPRARPARRDPGCHPAFTRRTSAAYSEVKDRKRTLGLMLQAFYAWRQQAVGHRQRKLRLQRGLYWYNVVRRSCSDASRSKSAWLARRKLHWGWWAVRQSAAGHERACRGRLRGAGAPAAARAARLAPGGAAAAAGDAGAAGRGRQAAGGGADHRNLPGAGRRAHVSGGSTAPGAHLVVTGRRPVHAPLPESRRAARAAFVWAARRPQAAAAGDARGAGAGAGAAGEARGQHEAGLHAR